MSDLFSLIVNAIVVDKLTDEVIGTVTDIETDGKNMRIKTIIMDVEDDDPDDGEKEEIPEVKKDNVTQLRSVASV